MIRQLIAALFGPPKEPEMPISEKILALGDDERSKLFVEDDTNTEPHALYSDHHGNLLVLRDAGERIESCGLVRLISPIQTPSFIQWSLPDEIGTMKEFELASLRTLIGETLLDIERAYRGNLFAREAA